MVRRFWPKIVRNKPRSVQVLGVRDQWTFLALRTRAARPRIKDMIRDATTAGLAAAQPLLSRLDALVGTATAAFLDTLDDCERAKRHLDFQKAAPVADEAWEQIVHGHNGWSIACPTVADVERTDPGPQEDKDGEKNHRCLRSKTTAERTAAASTTVWAV